MQNGTTKLLAILMALASMAITGCGGAGQNLASSGPAPTPGQVPAPAAGQTSGNRMPGLPSDAHGTPGRSASAVLVIPGSAAVDSANGAVVDTTMVLSGSQGNTAWALYKAEGLSGKKVTSVVIDVTPDPAGSYGVGVSNFSDGVWDFIQAGSAPEFEFNLTDEMSRLTSQIGNLYFVVVTDNGSLTILQSTVNSRDLAPGEQQRPALGRDISVSEGLADKIVVQWEAVDGATSYELYRQADSGGGDGGGSAPGDLLATVPAVDGQASYVYEDATITLNQEYKYRVRGISSAGAGAFTHWRSGFAGTAPANQEPGNELQLSGPIESLDSASISVSGTAFDITPATIWLDQNKNVVSAADFAVGTNVEISGDPNAAGGWEASRVQMEDAAGVEEQTISGSIDALDAASISVGGQLFAITGTTEWFDINNLPAVQADFAVGNMVEISGAADGLGGWNATSVKAEDQGATQELTQIGAIEALDASSITVAGQLFAITASTTWTDSLGAPLTQADFAVGLGVEVSGDSDGAGGWNARVVKKDDQGGGGAGGGGADTLELLGAVEALDAGSITVQGVTFAFNDATKWLDLNKNVVGPDSFTVGMPVDINGASDGQGGWVATKVKMEK